MATLDDIVEQARRLPLRDRRELAQKIEDMLADDEASMTASSGAGPYATTLAASGSGHTDFADVSTDKYGHLAEAYADRHDR